MKSLEEAQAAVLEAIVPTNAEIIPRASGFRRVLAAPVASRVDLPGFDNSAMDGYAVRAADTSGASADHPLRLKVIGVVPAGKCFDGTLGAGQCVRIFTGSPLPVGADAVIMQEDVRAGSEPGSLIECLDSVKPWENIRFKGEESKTGQILAESGTLVTSRRIGQLAAAGVSEITAHRRPSCGILVTGGELRSDDEALKPGEIYESNGRMLATELAELGLAVFGPRLVPDDRDLTRAALEQTLGSTDVVIATGGASVGDFDFVKPAFLEAGGAIDFWRVAIRPGKPFLFGQRDGKYFFGLPGNPVSAWVTFLLLVRPALMKLMGASHCLPRRMQVRTGEVIHNRGGRRHFMRARFDPGGRAVLSGLQGSHGLNGLADAEMLLDVPPEARLEPGVEVSAILL